MKFQYTIEYSIQSLVHNLVNSFKVSLLFFSFLFYILAKKNY